MRICAKRCFTVPGSSLNSDGIELVPKGQHPVKTALGALKNAGPENEKPSRNVARLCS